MASITELCESPELIVPVRVTVEDLLEIEENFFRLYRARNPRVHSVCCRVDGCTSDFVTAESLSPDAKYICRNHKYPDALSALNSSHKAHEPFIEAPVRTFGIIRPGPFEYIQRGGRFEYLLRDEVSFEDANRAHMRQLNSILTSRRPDSRNADFEYGQYERKLRKGHTSDIQDINDSDTGFYEQKSSGRLSPNHKHRDSVPEAIEPFIQGRRYVVTERIFLGHLKRESLSDALRTYFHPTGSRGFNVGDTALVYSFANSREPEHLPYDFAVNVELASLPCAPFHGKSFVMERTMITHTVYFDDPVMDSKVPRWDDRWARPYIIDRNLRPTAIPTPGTFEFRREKQTTLRDKMPSDMRYIFGRPINREIAVEVNGERKSAYRLNELWISEWEPKDERPDSLVTLAGTTKGAAPIHLNFGDHWYKRALRRELRNDDDLPEDLTPVNFEDGRASVFVNPNHPNFLLATRIYDEVYAAGLRHGQYDGKTEKEIQAMKKQETRELERITNEKVDFARWKLNDLLHVWRERKPVAVITSGREHRVFHLDITRSPEHVAYDGLVSGLGGNPRQIAIETAAWDHVDDYFEDRLDRAVKDASGEPAKHIALTRTIQENQNARVFSIDFGSLTDTPEDAPDELWRLADAILKHKDCRDVPMANHPEIKDIFRFYPDLYET